MPRKFTSVVHHAYLIIFLHILFLFFGKAQQNINSERRRPNIVILMSDDQDLMLGSMDVMHFTREHIVTKGASFRNAFTTSPICCPSRSSFLTGLYSHNHNVLTNNDNCSSPMWQKTHETRTFATYLNNSGYATAYFGKYLNEYNGSYIPPGWQYWMGLLKNTRYYNYTLRHNDQRETHRDNYEKDYFTDLIVNRSLDYFQRQKFEEPDKPILTMLSFPAPHGPEDAAPKYQNLYANVSSHITPSFDFGPNDDKHWIISQHKNAMDDIQHRFSSLLQQKRLQTLRSVDDGIERFVQMLNETGELNNTYILYTSDHGYHIGQLRLAKGKSMPYDFDIRIPFYLRGPDVPTGTYINEIVLNIDVAPSILGMAGIEVPDWMDGRNFMPLIRKRSSLTRPWRDTFLVERGKIPLSKIHMARPRLPSKQEKVESVCRRPEYKHPCVYGQVWTCAPEAGITKMRKCNKFKPPPRPPKRKKACSCSPKSTKNRIPPSCVRRILNTLGKSRRRRLHKRDISASNNWLYDHFFDEGLSRQRRKAPSYYIQKGGDMSNATNPHVRRITPQCTLNLNSFNIKCTDGPKSLKRDNLRKTMKRMKDQLRVMKILQDCEMRAPREKCRCSGARTSNKRRISKRSTKSSGNVNPIKLVFQEMREEHNQRMQAFRQWRREHLSERQLKKEKASKRVGDRKCSSRGLTCFALDENRWLNKPTWVGPERCYCTNASNNTYWCIRTINATANLLYCEFITGFVEYYDFNKDPHQLYNTYHDLDSEVHTALNDELAQLRVCKKEKSCYISRERQETATTLTTTSEVVPASTTTPTTITTDEAPVQDPDLDVVGSTAEISSTSTLIKLPTNHPPVSRRRFGRRRKNRRPSTHRVPCNLVLRRRGGARRWRTFCRKKRRSTVKYHKEG